MTDLERAFYDILCEEEMERDWVQEYRFHPERKWRFDWACKSLKIACECEGGAFVNGRHVRGTGFTKDCEKYSEAASRGWIVLRYTSKKQMQSFRRHWEQAIKSRTDWKAL